MLHGYFAMGEQRIDGVARFVRLYQFDAITIVHTAFITEPAIAIENKYVRCRLRAIRVRYRLRFPIVKVRIGQMLVLCSDLHLLETVADIRGIEFVDGDCLWIIGLNRNDRDTPSLVICHELRNTALIHLCDGAMIAGEDHHENWTGRVVRELMNRSIYARKFELWRWGIQRENRVRCLPPRAQREHREYQSCPNVVSHIGFALLIPSNLLPVLSYFAKSGREVASASIKPIAHLIAPT